MRRFLSVLLLLLFSVYATPRELWHAFSDHEDTVHHHLQGRFIEPEHHHCELLQFNQHLPLALQWNEWIEFSNSISFYSSLSFSYQNRKQGITPRSSKPLRAPPAMA